MALNIGAILGGAAEQIVDMQEDKIQRVNLLTDKYWDQHTQNMFDKKAKEDAKAELVENSIQKLSSFYDGNIDAGAALYNKLGGNIETADEFYKAALYQRDTLGEDIKPMLGSIDENFEASGMSAADYAASFRKPVSLDITIPEGTDSKVAKEIQKRKTEMEEAGLLPKGIKTDKPTFAELKGFDRSQFNTSTNIDLIQQNLITKLDKLDVNSETYEEDKAKLENRIFRINTLKQKAEEGIYDDPVKTNQTVGFLRSIVNERISKENNVEKTGTRFIRDENNNIISREIVNATTAKEYLNSIMPGILEEYTSNVSPKDREYFNSAAKLLGYETEAEDVGETSVEESANEVANTQGEDATVTTPKVDTSVQVPKKAIDAVKNNPKLKNDFIQKYGQQAYDQIFKNKKQTPVTTKVNPRPDGNTNPSLVGDMMEWDRNYGKTHNYDGTPKQKQV
jgi:hypothetical protein